MLQLDSPLWQFAIQFYQKGKNAQLLLALQEREGLWINQWLATLWAAKHGYELPNKPDDMLAQWHTHVVLPVRQLRQKMRDSKLYSQLLDLELQKERVELAHWYRLASKQVSSANWQERLTEVWPNWQQWPESKALMQAVDAN
ncbi:DUF2390 domain-containing protein [Salinibius halmophilus]|uniref:DUF2390 domain-containing protein n=1 Tax=Salinibius halmophilus TaxID=1853216 RepID=UPI000E66342F|nr:DUF2390 domain-containing protein [Salinibius halmophilus]